MKTVDAMILSGLFGLSGVCSAVELIGGQYGTEPEESYYDALISIGRDFQGHAVNLTERFIVEGIPTKPFYFACMKNLCTNLEKSHWTITILSSDEYEDRYGSMYYRYVLINPLPDDSDDSDDEVK